MITSAQNLTEVTASLIDQDPLVNQWMNTFLNKADYQISAVEVADSDNLFNVPTDENQFAAISNRFASQGSFATKTGVNVKSAFTSFTKLYVGGAIQEP